MSARSLFAPPSILQPGAPEAERIADLWWWMLGLGSVAILLVTGLVLVVVWRRRGPSREAGRSGGAFLVGGGLVLPSLLLVPVSLLTVWVGTALHEQAGDPLEVEVVGSQWWWQASYPGTGVVTANEIHVPSGRPVTFRIGSADVIHSFWVPRGGPKIDAIPGEVTEVTMTFQEPGVYWGVCAEFCGLQHAQMQLLVIVEEPEGFEAWVEDQAEPAAEPETALEERGRDLVTGGPCIGCHTIRGVMEVASVAPDLTHLASRTTMAGAFHELDRENLRRWLEDPDHLKPGALMPAPRFGGDDLSAVVAYLESLE